MAGKSGGTFSVTMKNGNKLAQKIEKIKTGGETAIKHTVSDFKSSAPGWISKGIRQHYGVDTAAVKNAGPSVKRGATHIRISGMAVDDVELLYKGRTLTTKHFSQSPTEAPSGRKAKEIRVPGQAVKTDGGSPVAMISTPKKYTVKATIIKGNRTKFAPGTFIATSNGAKLPFQRQGAGRTPIEAIRTVSVPQMISGDRAKGTIEKLVAENVEKRFYHHVERAMK